MIYILAGADGVGKSTVFSKLRSVFPKAVFIKGSCNLTVEEKLERLDYYDKLSKCEEVVICDRLHVLDDLVYTPLFEHKPSIYLSEPFKGRVVSMLRAATVIYLDCCSEVLQQRLDSRGDEYVSAADIPSIRASYERVFEELYLRNVNRVDASQPEDKVFKAVLGIIRKKSFRLAHIVPVNCLRDTLLEGYHMCLANIAVKNDAYMQHYTRLARGKEHFVLMDNGAAEGEQLDISELIECYDKVCPDEIVLPDTLLNGEETYFKSMQAYRTLCAYYSGSLPFTLMAVPQGRTLGEWVKWAGEFIYLPFIKTIGIPKVLTEVVQDPFARVFALNHLENLICTYGRYDVEVHLLGCNESPQQIKMIRERYPFVRGCDSAFSYLCAQADVKLDAATARPEGKIDFIAGKPYDLLRANIRAFDKIVGVKETELDESWR